MVAGESLLAPLNLAVTSQIPGFAIGLAGGGRSQWNLGRSNFPRGPSSPFVQTKRVSFWWSRVDVPKLHCGALLALDTIWRPNALHTGAVSNSCLRSFLAVSRSSLPMLHAGADVLAELGCEPSPKGILCEPGPV